MTIGKNGVATLKMVTAVEEINGAHSSLPG